MGRLWFDRRFDLGLPIEEFPGVLERVRGTPARLEERVAGLAPGLLTRRLGESWSIQQHVGHLGDLEELWAARLEELLTGREELQPADLENRKTYQADHNAKDLVELLGTFRRQRQATVDRLEPLGGDALRRTARHPRLDQPMSIVDLFYFVAEHDDHHLASITTLLLQAEEGA